MNSFDVQKVIVGLVVGGAVLATSIGLLSLLIYWALG